MKFCIDYIECPFILTKNANGQTSSYCLSSYKCPSGYGCSYSSTLYNYIYLLQIDNDEKGMCRNQFDLLPSDVILRTHSVIIITDNDSLLVLTVMIYGQLPLLTTLLCVYRTLFAYLLTGFDSPILSIMCR